MGQVEAKLNDTNWYKCDGKLTKPSQTIDLVKPTPRVTIVNLVKRSKSNHREYTVYDSVERVLYVTQEIAGSSTWFYLLGGNGKRVLLIKTGILRKHWEVLRFGKPAFEGQVSDLEATKQAVAETPLYHVAHITVSGDRYNAKVALYGPPKSEDDRFGTVDVDRPILEMESVRGGQAEYQTRLPRTSGKAGGDPTDGGDWGYPAEGGAADGEKEPKKDDDELVGHWKWHNTPKRHAMKMHLAKNSDLAVHVVLAVLINRIRTKQVANDVGWEDVAKLSPIVITKEKEKGGPPKVTLRAKHKKRDRDGPDEGRRDATKVDQKDSIGAVDRKEAHEAKERSAVSWAEEVASDVSTDDEKKKNGTSRASGAVVDAAAAAGDPKGRTERADAEATGAKRPWKLALATAVAAAGASFGVGRYYGASGGGPLLSMGGPLGEAASGLYERYFPASAASSSDGSGESQPKP